MIRLMTASTQPPKNPATTPITVPIETESMVALRGDGAGGRTFEGPRWFFREEKIAYWRSEFVTTNTEENPIAAAAITGLSSPSAASGIAATL